MLAMCAYEYYNNKIHMNCSVQNHNGSKSTLENCL